MPLPAGAARYRFTVERLKPQSTGRFGERKEGAENWFALDRVWGSVEALSAREIVQSDRTQAVITYRVRIRTYSGQKAPLTERDRLRWKGGILNIQSIQLRGSRLEEQELLCAQEVD